MSRTSRSHAMVVPVVAVAVALGFHGSAFSAESKGKKGDKHAVEASRTVTAATSATPAPAPTPASAPTESTAPEEGGRQGGLTERDIPLTVALLYKQVGEDLRTIDRVALQLKQFENDARGNNMVVLLNAVSEDVKAVDGIVELAKEQYTAMNETYPPTANLPDEDLRKLSVAFPREIAILRDRASALYRRSKEFADTLNKPTGTTIQRIAAEGEVEEP